MKKKLKVAVGISGGVDSALAAALLKEQGYDVTGVFMECWNEQGCRTDDDRKDALKVALKLKIPFKVLDFKKEYRQKVVDWFYKEYKKGRTPNPDIVCNQEIKFGIFYDWMVKQGFDFMATIHYARGGADSANEIFPSSQLPHSRRGATGAKIYLPASAHLYRSADENKDQTYFLALLKERQLKKVLFPIGHLTKDKVRQEAKKRGLPVWDKKDSTGICFIGNDYSFSEFLKRRIKPHEGQVIDKKEKVIGTHQGIEFYTIGQRHGFKVNPRSTSSAPLFVVSKKAKKNQLIVGSKQDLAKKEFGVEKWQWIGGEPAKKNGLLFRIRHRGELVPGKIIGKKVRLTKTVFGVAPGQVAVVYDGLECLGGGVISA